MNSTPFISDFLYKILLIGNSGVGKSCLLMRYSVTPFTRKTHSPTISSTPSASTSYAHYQKIKSVILESHPIRLQIVHRLISGTPPDRNASAHSPPHTTAAPTASSSYTTSPIATPSTTSKRGSKKSTDLPRPL